MPLITVSYSSSNPGLSVTAKMLFICNVQYSKAHTLAIEHWQRASETEGLILFNFNSNLNSYMWAVATILFFSAGTLWHLGSQFFNQRLSSLEAWNLKRLDYLGSPMATILDSTVSQTFTGTFQERKITWLSKLEMLHPKLLIVDSRPHTSILEARRGSATQKLNFSQSDSFSQLL